MTWIWGIPPADAIVATYCQSKMVELSKSKSTQPNYLSRRTSLYKSARLQQDKRRDNFRFHVPFMVLCSVFYKSVGKSCARCRHSAAGLPAGSRHRLMQSLQTWCTIGAVVGGMVFAVGEGDIDLELFVWLVSTRLSSSWCPFASAFCPAVPVSVSPLLQMDLVLHSLAIMGEITLLQQSMPTLFVCRTSGISDCVSSVRLLPYFAFMGVLCANG